MCCFDFYINTSTLNSFPNYNELYIFLKKKGYIKKYYDDYAKKIIINYVKFYKKLDTEKKLIKIKKTIQNKIKDFNKIDLSKYINIDKIYKK